MPRDIEAAKSNLMRSAFDFLSRAIDDFDSDLKFSIINFATAIELLLKARLMNEHWTLVVDRTSEADMDAFLDGKARTVTPREAVRRLEKVCRDPIGQDAAASFEVISQHRNRMIHFFHEAATPEARNADKEQVAAEQCVCWFYLEQLFARWTDQVADFEQQIAGIRWKMRRNARFLAVKFERLAPEIEAAKAAGAAFAECAGCGHEAAKIEELSDQLAEHHCQVCGLFETRLIIACPACEAAMPIDHDYAETRICTACNNVTTASELADILDTEYRDPMEHTPINCAHCTSPDSVVLHGERYICSICLEMDETIAGCEWCNECQMGGGDLEMSFETGCEFCDGRAGWRRDD